MATRPAKASRTGNPRRAGERGESAGPSGPAAPPHAPAGAVAPPRALRVAAAVQAVEAVGMLVAAAFAAVATAAGQSYQRASGIALTLIAAGVAVGFAIFAVNLARARPWTRIPVVMTQLFVIIAGITLLDGHRPEWGVPALLLAAGCLVAMFTPASLRALNRPPRP